MTLYILCYIASDIKHQDSDIFLKLTKCISHIHFSNINSVLLFFPKFWIFNTFSLKKNYQTLLYFDMKNEIQKIGDNSIIKVVVICILEFDAYFVLKLDFYRIFKHLALFDQNWHAVASIKSI